MTTRRVVTGINEAGKSYFVHDGATPGHVDLGLAVDDEIWIDDPSSPDPHAARDSTSAGRADDASVSSSALRPATFVSSRL